MFSKFIKTLFVLILIFCVNMSSFAAISVADGSAFVTRAEFSSDISNLTNRISQMENSLDAKIDSLVSAYLTRNGIWNGAVQTKITTEYDHAIPAISIASGGSASQVINSNKYNLFESNKSGMAFINYYFKSNATTPNNARWGYFHYSASATNWYSDHKVFLSLHFIDMAKQSENIYVKEIGKAMASKIVANMNPSSDKHTQYDLVIPIPLNRVDLNAMFFVSKGVKYGFFLKTTVVIDPTYNKIGNVPTLGATIKFYFDKILVY